MCLPDCQSRPPWLARFSGSCVRLPRAGCVTVIVGGSSLWVLHRGSWCFPKSGPQEIFLQPLKEERTSQGKRAPPVFPRIPLSVGKVQLPCTSFSGTRARRQSTDPGLSECMRNSLLFVEGPFYASPFSNKIPNNPVGVRLVRTLVFSNNKNTLS